MISPNRGENKKYWKPPPRKLSSFQIFTKEMDGKLLGVEKKSPRRLGQKKQCNMPFKPPINDQWNLSLHPGSYVKTHWKRNGPPIVIINLISNIMPFPLAFQRSYHFIQIKTRKPPKKHGWKRIGVIFSAKKNTHLQMSQEVCNLLAITYLSGWLFQPIWKISYSQNGHLAQIGVNFKNVWNHY